MLVLINALSAFFAYCAMLRIDCPRFVFRFQWFENGVKINIFSIAFDLTRLRCANVVLTGFDKLVALAFFAVRGRE